MNLSLLLQDIHPNPGYWAMIEIGAPGGVQLSHIRASYLHVALAGTLLIRIVDGETRTLQPGQFAWFPEGLAHSVVDAEQSQPTPIAYFSRAHKRRDVPAVVRVGGQGVAARMLTGAFRVNVPPGNPFMKLAAPYHVDAAPMIQYPGFEQELSRAGANAFIDRLADTLLLSSLRKLIVGAKPDRDAGLFTARVSQMQVALGLMQARLDERWTVARLGQEVGMSRTIFATEFVKSIGQSPMRYLANARMAKAAQLLTCSDARLIEVAASVGYESETTFSRVFRSHHGVPPAAYRRKHRIGNQPPRRDAEWSPYFNAV